MISRREFVALLASLPLIGKTLVLGKLVSPPYVPPGFVQCAVCGEFNGTTAARNLSWHGHSAPRHKVTVTCLCHGFPCKYCGKLLHRPISNEYDPETNSIWHQPYFAGWFGCWECEEKRREAWDNMPKAKKKRIIRERNRQLEKLGFKRVSASTWIGPANPKRGN